jgi:hypothetical protein
MAKLPARGRSAEPSGSIRKSAASAAPWRGRLGLASRVLLVAGLACIPVAGLSCRPQIRQSVPPRSNAEQPLTGVAPAGALAWSATRRLAWSDFRARPPAGRPEAAVTATSLIWGFHCTGDEFTFQAVAVFLPDQSWVDATISIQLGSGLETLRHEQTHFDLTEVFARRLRQFFRTLSRPCDGSAERISDSGDRFVHDESDAQRRYDEATANGRAAAAQSRWDRDVQQWLEALAPYAVR